MSFMHLLAISINLEPSGLAFSKLAGQNVWKKQFSRNYLFWNLQLLTICSI